MGCLGNVLWFIFGGFISGLSWLGIGLLWCLTIVGIPIGLLYFVLFYRGLKNWLFYYNRENSKILLLSFFLVTCLNNV